MLCVPLIGTLGSIFRAPSRHRKKRTKKEYDLFTELYEVSQSIYGLSRAMEDAKITWSLQTFGVKTSTGLRGTQTTCWVLAKPRPTCVTLCKVAQLPLHLSF